MSLDANTSSFNLSHDSASVALADASGVGEARRLAGMFSDRIGLDDSVRSNISIVATELANNVIRHAKSGELIIRAIQRGRGWGGQLGIEMLSVDQGPGIANTADAVRDGFSTGRTPGTGLGAVRRLSGDFDLYSSPGCGTAVLSRVWAQGTTSVLPLVPEALYGVICLPKAEEVTCGDSWAIERRPDRTMVLVVDGLGHGSEAARAAREAVKTFRDNLTLGPARILESIHAALRSTRGAAAAVAAISPGAGQVIYAGVGNTAAMILPDALSDMGRSLVSHNGTLGAEARRFQEFIHPWPAGSLLLMHTDGLGSQWQLRRYAGIRARHPALLTALLYRDFRRSRDDVTVLAVRDDRDRPGVGG